MRSGENSPAVDPANARLNVAVLPYQSADNAATEYDTRVQQVTQDASVEMAETPLAGEWTLGVMINGRDQATDRVYALVQNDSYLLKIELSWDSDAEFFDKYPFTRGDVAGSFQTMMTPFSSAVSANAGG